MNSEQIEKLFSIAKNRELEAHQFYLSVSEKVKDPNVKGIFAQLAREEMGHYELLETFRNDPTASMKISAPPTDWKVAEAEELPKLSTDLKPRDAMALAMKKEQQAVEFYRSLSAAATDTETRSMFDNLANMELGHKHRLEKLFVDIGYPEAF